MTLRETPLTALWLVLALALLPIGRGVEYAMGVLSMLGVIALLRRAPDPGDPAWRGLGILFVAFLLPMLLALPDAVAVEKSSMTTIGAGRYLLSCVALLWVLQRADVPGLFQQRVLDAVGVAACVLLAFWCVDGLLQFLTGTNILGYGMEDGYINGIFGEDDNIKFGITVALLLPLALGRALRRWPPFITLAFVLLVILLVILSGKRAAWVSLAVELAVLALFLVQQGRLSLQRLLAVVLLVVVAVGSAYLSSDWVRQRSDVFVEAVDQPDFATLNRASGKRLPIWRTALRIGDANWLNGVGPRGFRFAYTEFADADDHWAQRMPGRNGARAAHAHQLVLELYAETGVLGLLGLLVMVATLWRLWWRAGDAARWRALPFAIALTGMLFPLNSHAAFYSSWSATLMWLFIGLYLFALREPGVAGESSA